MTTKLISKIYIEKLFGQYTYTLPKNNTDESLQDATIIYGDNGVGKSTLLRIIFHLLSAAENRGHRTALCKYNFENISISLTSGIILKASFNKQKRVKSLILTIEKESKIIALWEYNTQDEDHGAFDENFLVSQTELYSRIFEKNKSNKKKTYPASIPQGEHFYIEALREHAPNIFILNAERRLDSDSIADPSDEMELRRFMQFESPKRIYDLVVRSREIALSQAMGSASRWISKKAVIGTNKGTTNVHSVYLDVLRHITSPSESVDHGDSINKIQDLQSRLIKIEEKTIEHAKYELATQLSINEFKKSLSSKTKEKQDLAAQLLEPYVTSIEQRLAAVDPIFQLIDKFVRIVNGFLNDKEIKFTLSQGFCIVNKVGVDLEYSQLSSGEQQLLLLFSYVLVARDQPSVFMIDEPEISLNIKWQRKLIQSLLDITKDSSIQFIFASHSIELLTQHRNRVVKLQDQNNV